MTIKQLCSLIAVIAFTLGMLFGRWDAVHGKEWGYKIGVKTRDFFKKDKTDV